MLKCFIRCDHIIFALYVEILEYLVEWKAPEQNYSGIGIFE